MANNSGNHGDQNVDEDHTDCEDNYGAGGYDDDEAGHVAYSICL